MAQEDKSGILKLIEAHRKRLQLLEEKAALYGIDCPPHVTLEIEDIKRDLNKLNLRVVTSIDLKFDNVFSLADQVERKLNAVDSDLRKVTVKETKTISIFGFTILSTVVERIIMFAIPFLFILIIGGTRLLYSANQNNSYIRSQAQTAQIQSVQTAVAATLQAKQTAVGSWSGTTEQGEPVTFSIEPDAGGFSAVNLSVSSQFEPSCPIGKVIFRSVDAAHIFGPPETSFSFLGLKDPKAVGHFQADISGQTASGTLVVVDARSPSERINRECDFSTIIRWTATKQQ